MGFLLLQKAGFRTCVIFVLSFLKLSAQSDKRKLAYKKQQMLVLILLIINTTLYLLSLYISTGSF